VKTPVRILFSGFLLLTAVLTSGFDSSHDKTGKSSPQYEGIIVIPGLTGSVNVYRDEKGMPHIYATCEHDLYLATGYVAAQERLWQMDLVRRSSTGRMAEIFGKAFVQTDILTRCLGIKEKSKSMLQNEEPVIAAAMKAYADGVNAFISSPGRKLPFEFRVLSYEPEPWTPEDIVGILGLLGWNLSTKNLADEIFNYSLVLQAGVEKASGLIPDWDVPNDFAYPDFHISDSMITELSSLIASAEKVRDLGVSASSGSNNWAVSGDRTATGRPVLSNDMHLTLTNPGIWMQMHQVIPGLLNVTGVMIPGEPFIVAGHNEKIAWGMTNLMSDDIDIYAEKINPDNPNQYFFNGEWKDMTGRPEIISVKGGKQDTVVIRSTHRGPLLTGLLKPADPSQKVDWTGYEYLHGFDHADSIALSMRWVGYDVSDEVRSVYKLNRAKGWDDFRSALSTFRLVSQNVVYADTDGNIGLNAAGGIPVRKGNGIMIRSGETGEYDWQGYVPFEQLPYSFNPANGSVSSANNKTADSNYPYFISQSYFSPYRIHRIRQMLDEKAVLGMDDFKRMVNDQRSYLAALLTPFILRLKDRSDEMSPAENTALKALADWDYNMDPDLLAPSVLEFFRISFRRNILADELGHMYEHLNYLTGEYFIYMIITDSQGLWIDNVNTDPVETIDDIVMQSFRDGIAALIKDQGKNPENWKWGKINTLTFVHPLGTVKILDLIFNLNSDSYGVGGSDHTVSPFFSLKPGFKVNVGASVRQIFNTADWDESYTVIPGGASGVPHSEFYLSQVPAYIRGEFYKDHFSDEAVLSSAKYTLILQPPEQTP
jgi:penicillin G amidase